MNSFESIGGLLDLAFSGGVGVIIAIVIIAFIIWLRTRSTHVLMTRLWSYFHGKAECKLPAVAAFFDEQAAIHQFRFTTGIPVKSAQQLADLLKFAQQNNQEVSAIAAAGTYFDLSTMSLKDAKKRPGPKLLVIIATATAVLLMLLTLILAAISVDRAFLQMKASGTWFTLDQNYAKPFSDAPGFQLSSCKQPETITSNITGFTDADRDAICRHFAKADTAGYVKSTVQSQRWALGFLAVFFLYLTIVTYSMLSQAAAARTLEKRLTDAGT